MSNLRERILALYRENWNISSKEILTSLGIEQPTPEFWRILNEVQVGLRGVSPDRGKNRGRWNSKMRGFHKGNIYWIPPEKKE